MRTDAVRSPFIGNLRLTLPTKRSVLSPPPFPQTPHKTGPPSPQQRLRRRAHTVRDARCTLRVACVYFPPIHPFVPVAKLSAPSELLPPFLSFQNPSAVRVLAQTRRPPPSPTQVRAFSIRTPAAPQPFLAPAGEDAHVRRKSAVPARAPPAAPEKAHVHPVTSLGGGRRLCHPKGNRLGDRRCRAALDPPPRGRPPVKGSRRPPMWLPLPSQSFYNSPCMVYATERWNKIVFGRRVIDGPS